MKKIQKYLLVGTIIFLLFLIGVLSIYIYQVSLENKSSIIPSNNQGQKEEINEINEQESLTNDVRTINAENQFTNSTSSQWIKQNINFGLIYYNGEENSYSYNLSFEYYNGLTFIQNGKHKKSSGVLIGSEDFVLSLGIPYEGYMVSIPETPDKILSTEYLGDLNCYYSDNTQELKRKYYTNEVLNQDCSVYGQKILSPCTGFTIINSNNLPIWINCELYSSNSEEECDSIVKTLQYEKTDYQLVLHPASSP